MAKEQFTCDLVFPYSMCIEGTYLVKRVNKDSFVFFFFFLLEVHGIEFAHLQLVLYIHKNPRPYKKQSPKLDI